MSDAPAIRKYEMQEKLEGAIAQLQPSQRAFIFAPERFSMMAGGFASGKTFALCLKGIILSAAIPGNVGYFTCLRGTDVEKRILPVFFELCPKAWIRNYFKKTQTVVLRNNSIVRFEHLADGNSGSGAKTRILGANLGFALVDQAEEILQEHWDALASRLRLPRAPKKFLGGSMNPAGKDWLYDKFFTQMKPWPKDEDGKVIPLDGKYYQEMRPAPNTLGIAVNSEENRISNGGHVEDAYFDSLLDTYGEQWVNRFVHCSFTDFKGKLFPDYVAGLVDDKDASVHNIEPFDIPRHWSCIGGIDPGGDSPWGVVPVYSDEKGNLIVTPGYHNRGGRVSEVANWIKHNTPYNENRTTFFIDPENRVVTVELNDYGIYCQTANKEVFPGLLRMEGYFHIQKHRELPDWYEDTQPAHKFQMFRGKGSPQIFVFKNALVWRKEHDMAKWHPDKPDQMFKTSTLRLDSVEATRYVVMSRPAPSKTAVSDDAKYEHMYKHDPATAREWLSYEKRLETRRSKMREGLLDMDAEEATPFSDAADGRYDFQAKDE